MSRAMNNGQPIGGPALARSASFAATDPARMDTAGIDRAGIDWAGIDRAGIDGTRGDTTRSDAAHGDTTHSDTAHGDTTHGDTAPVLDIRDLQIEAGGRRVVDGVSFSVAPGEFLSLVGESGSGKSLTGRAVLRLLPAGVQQTGGTIHVHGRDLMRASPAQMRALRGPVLGMIFQEPMTSLNPALTIGAQMSEALRLHQRLPHDEVRRRCLAMLERVGIDGGERCLRAYSHEYSGGMRQRIMIASVMLLAPKLLIADEPTTALDTLIQREVLDLMTELAREQGTAVVLITHNLGLVARYTQHAVVMQQGRVVETGRRVSCCANRVSRIRARWSMRCRGAPPSRPLRRNARR